MRRPVVVEETTDHVAREIEWCGQEVSGREADDATAGAVSQSRPHGSDALCAPVRHGAECGHVADSPGAKRRDEDEEHEEKAQHCPGGPHARCCDRRRIDSQMSVEHSEGTVTSFFCSFFGPFWSSFLRFGSPA